MYVLGGGCLIERVKRCLASCEEDCESRVGKCVQLIAGPARNPCVLLYRLRFASRFGKLGQHNNARIARTKAEEAAPKTYQNPTKILEKSIENRRKIDEKSLLGSFGRSRPCRGRVGTRSGRLLDAQKSLQGRSWGAPGAPRAAKSRPKASPGRSQDTAGPPRSDVRAHSEHQAVSNKPAERFFDVFSSSRKNSDVRKMYLLP